jgi:Beta-xylosidase
VNDARSPRSVSARLWDAFGPDWRENCRRWRRFSGNPALPPSGDTWKRVWTANPDFRWRADDNTLLVYYRGHGTLAGSPAGERTCDRLAVARVDALGPDGLRITDLNGGLPVVDVGPEGAFDAAEALDPSAAEFAGRVLLFYSALGPGEHGVGLAVSTDGTAGERFAKHGPVLTGRAPSALAQGDRVYLLYQDWLPGHAAERQQWCFYLAVSEDGLTFSPVQDAPILTGTPGDWDAYSVVTGRLLAGADGWTYLLYGGSAYLSDEPEHFGLARSRDLVNWEKHPGNPIFGAGARGEPDGGAIWFPALWETDTHFHLLYEGSEGPYAWNLRSAVCLASREKTV